MTNLRKFGALAMALAGLLAFSGTAYAAVTVSGSLTNSVSSDSATGASVALPVLVLTEGAAGDIGTGTLTFALPSGFNFDTGSLASVSFGGTGLAGSSSVSFPDATRANITITGTSTVAGTLTVGSTMPLKVKVTNGSSVGTSGNITLSSGTVAGFTSTTSLGTLTQVPGAANKLAFTAQPSGTITVNSTFPTVTVAVKDQFNNTLTADNGRAITVSAVAANPSTTLGTTLLGTTTVNDTNGLANFTNLSFSQPASLQLSAQSTGLVQALGNILSLVAAGTTTPPTSTPPSLNCGLQNGKLVKVAGSSTVYMVVNCVLRPFTTPALFHAKGKKFRDIKEISSSLFATLSVGRAVGDGHDDDDTVIIPPTNSSTSTPTSTLSGLPNGAIVKLPNNPTIFLVSNGQLQPFTSALTFNLHGKKFGDVTTISQDQFNQLTVGAPVSLPDGTLIKASGSTIFVIQGGQKVGVTSMSALKKHGWSLKNLKKVSDDDLNSITSGGIAD